VWCPHDTEAFLPGRVQSRAGGIATVELAFADGRRETASVPEKSCTAIASMVALSDQVDDLVQLAEVNDPSIVHLLRARFMQDKIYTWVGNILVAVNPFKQLDLYTPTVIEKVQHRGPVEAEPHTYVIADLAYQNMRRFRRGQSILISGESGAGKTETTKHALTYLSEVAGGESGVEQKVLSANPILEAFGNAKTLRNNNSSRFGKLMCLAFDKKTFEICGCATENYLLEKSRVVRQSPNERNYHIFYMLCKTQECQQEFCLDSADEYNYLNMSGCLAIEGLDDGEELKSMVAAMNGIGFTDQERGGVFSVVSSILHLGNIEFEAQEGGNAEGSCLTDRSRYSLGQAARLLEVDEALLEASLGELNYTIRGESVRVLLTPDKAADARDALSKALYGNQFDWLVKRANDAMRPPTIDPSAMIGILDIFGFEIFDKNSFEQLCINFANESE
jgi:myosin heavy subunit